jgi:hypothetical protein
MLWGGGRMRQTAVFGVWIGLVVTAVSLFGDDSVPAALGSGAFTGTVCAVLIYRQQQDHWRSGWALDRSDRLAVVAAVRKGQDIADPRLASATVDFADLVRRGRLSQSGHRWILWAAVVGMAGAAVWNLFEGSDVAALAWGAGAAALTGLIAYVIPRSERYWLHRAERAESLARNLLAHPSAPA